MKIPSQVVSKTYSILFSAEFGPFSTPFRGRVARGTMNVQIKPVHVMSCVVKCETPPVWRWKLSEFQHGKSISESGINYIGWRGSGFRPRILYPLNSVGPFFVYFFVEGTRRS